LKLSLSPDDYQRLAQTRVAYLFPALSFGNYWHPILSRFTRSTPKTQVYTGAWSGFSRGYEDKFQLTIVGNARFFPEKVSLEGRYVKNVSYLSPKVLGHLFRLRPHVVFVSAFSMWTLLVLLVKPLLGCRVVILYDGWSPTYDYQDSAPRLALRRWMAQRCDRLITNSQNGATYLTQALNAKVKNVIRIPYQVPDLDALQSHRPPQHPNTPTPQQPTANPFKLRLIVVGQLISRKGVDRLLHAIHLLQERGYHNIHLTCIGSGDQAEELRQLSETLKLDQVTWIGQVPYDRLGEYIQASDVFVFPTLEDVWGMAPLEAMVWGKPVICSQYAGCAELMLLDGKTGFQVDPNQPETIADAIQSFLDQPETIAQMGDRAKAHIEQFSPETATQALLALTLQLRDPI
jgi:glycosyltransferase involved in cell wall biosynthesis